MNPDAHDLPAPTEVARSDFAADLDERVGISKTVQTNIGEDMTSMSRE